MIDIPSEIEGIPVAIEFQGADRALLQELKALFNSPGEQVALSDAFGGSDALIVVAAFGKDTLERLIAFWPKFKFSAPKTTLRLTRLRSR